MKNWRDIKDRKTQFAALIVLLSLGVTSYVTFSTASRNLSQSTQKANQELRLADFHLKTGLQAPKNLVSRIDSVDGVRAALGRLVIDTALHLEDDKKAHARVIGLPTREEIKVNDLLLLRGEDVTDQFRNECIVDNKFSVESGKTVGDSLQITAGLTKKTIKVIGVGTNPEYFWAIREKGDFSAPGEFAVLFMDQRRVERLFGIPPSYNDFSVLIEEGADLDEVIEDVEDILEDYEILSTTKQADFPSNFRINEEVKQNESTGGMMSYLVLVISVLTLYISLSRMIQSQRGQIGLSKALGVRDWQILLHYLIFSLFIASVGSIIGVLLGQYLGGQLTQMYVSMLNIPILEFKVYPDVVIGGVALSSISCILAGIFPAINSARIPPAKAMHSDPNVGVTSGKIPLIERLFGWAMPSSFTFRIPFRNIFRIRRRSLYTVVGVVFSLILTVFTWSLFDSMNFMIDQQFYQIDRWDMLAVLNNNLPESRLRGMERVRGVSDVDMVLTMPAEFTANGIIHKGAISAIPEDATFHGFTETQGSDVVMTLEDDGLILPTTIAKKLKVGIGDPVEVETPYIKNPIEVEVMTINEELLGSPIFCGPELGKDLLNDRADLYNVVYLQIDQQRAEKIKDELYDIPGVYIVQHKQAILDYLNSMLGMMYLFGSIMFGFAFVIAFVVIYNTFTANILERTREIGTMMTIGEDRGHLAFMVTLENLILALAGIPFGLYLGLQAATAMYQSFSTEDYRLPAKLYPSSFVWMILVMLAIMLISEVPPIRRIFKLDLAEATKFME